MLNLILDTDSYKMTHWRQYPEGTEKVYSYLEARHGARFPYTVFFGLQPLLRRLAGRAVTQRQIEQAREVSLAHFGDPKMFNEEGWLHILKEHDGFLPVRIKAVAEGTKVPNSNVMMTVENTDPECYWLTNALESYLTHVWYSSTVATLSTYTIQDVIGPMLEQTTGSRAGLEFMLHDFGYRGATGDEAAERGGAAHLISSRGTDTLPAMLHAMEEYEAELDSLAFSVPATEHSVMTSMGPEGEMELFGNLLDEHPTGILSVVIDSYNSVAFVRQAALEFHDKIMARDGKLVFRPDSGNPVDQMVELSNEIEAHFGVTRNELDYKVFPAQVGLLWGDGIDTDGVADVLTACAGEGFAASNYVFGMGGALLQKLNRDTQRFAFKCSAQRREGEWIDIYKDPVTANQGFSTKASKRGRLALIKDGMIGYRTVPHVDGNGHDLLRTVFEDGVMFNELTFEEVRENALV